MSQWLHSSFLKCSGRTFDEYTSELLSGQLSWTPVHESENFWRENAVKLNDNDYKLLRFVQAYPTVLAYVPTSDNSILIKLLDDSSDPIVLAVAVHDLGQYVKHCDRGKKYY